METVVHAIPRTVAALKKDNARIKNENALLRRNLADTYAERNAHFDERNSYLKELEDTKKMLKTVRESLSRSEAENSATRIRMSNLSQQCEHYKHSHDQSEKSKHEMEIELKANVTEKKRVWDSLEEYEVKRQCLSAALDESNRQCELTETKLQISQGSHRTTMQKLLTCAQSQHRAEEAFQIRLMQKEEAIETRLMQKEEDWTRKEELVRMALNEKDEDLTKIKVDGEFEKLRAIRETNRIQREFDQRTKCIVCWELERDTVLQPCFHFVVCSHCIDRSIDTNFRRKFQCPICRADVKGSLAVRFI